MDSGNGLNGYEDLSGPAWQVFVILSAGRRRVPRQDAGGRFSGRL